MTGKVKNVEITLNIALGEICMNGDFRKNIPKKAGENRDNRKAAAPGNNSKRCCRYLLFTDSAG